MSYIFHPAAETEHLESVAYLESKRPGLGAMYLADFELLIEVVCESPRRYRVERQPDVRRASMGRFPYSVLFRESAGVVQVLAISHHRRRPNYWLERI